MSNIAVLHGNADACQRLRRAIAIDSVAGVSRIHEKFADWTDLLDRLYSVDSPLFSVGVLDPYHSGRFDIDRIQLLRREFPTLLLVAYSDFQSRPAQEAGLLALAGVSRLITLGMDDHAYQIREALAYLDGASCDSLRAAVTRRIGNPGGELFGDIYDAVSHVMCGVRHADAGGQSRSIISSLRRKLGTLLGTGSSRRGLERSLARMNLPSPGKLILLARLLHVGRLLDDPGRSIANVSMATGFDDGLHRVVKRETALTPDDLRRIGAFKTILSLVEIRLNSVHTARTPSHAKRFQAAVS